MRRKLAEQARAFAHDEMLSWIVMENVIVRGTAIQWMRPDGLTA